MKIQNLFIIILLVLLPFLCLAEQESAAQGPYPKTPADYEGPFYPVTEQQDVDNDLVHVKGQTGTAQGDILNLSGVVINTRGEVQKDIIIEIWQTDPQGRYKHPGDSTPGERDPNFQYWGAAITAADGTFFFKTIIPGAYEPRPAHIHYKVLQAGKVVLTSQMYFRDPSQGPKRFSMSSQVELQTVKLKAAKNGEFEAYFRIVL
jgi:protocatechuate 3,4-dioxygenase beta subunit